MIYYIICFLVILIIFLLYYCIKFALIILRVQEAIETSLDNIDEKYQRLSAISEIPVFFDTPEIKSVIRELQGVKNDILYIANQLSNSISNDEENTK